MHAVTRVAPSNANATAVMIFTCVPHVDPVHRMAAERPPSVTRAIACPIPAPAYRRWRSAPASACLDGQRTLPQVDSSPDCMPDALSRLYPIAQSHLAKSLHDLRWRRPRFMDASAVNRRSWPNEDSRRAEVSSMTASSRPTSHPYVLEPARGLEPRTC
jgi:hypothetical protein